MPVSCLLSSFAFVSAFSVARGAPRTGLIHGSAGPRDSPERRSAPRMARLFRAWQTCWDLPGRRGEPGPARAWSWKPGAALGCSRELLVGRGLLPAYLTQPSWVSVGTREAMIVYVFLLSFIFVALAPPLPPLGSDFYACFLFKNCLRSCHTNELYQGQSSVSHLRVLVRSDVEPRGQKSPRC